LESLRDGRVIYIGSERVDDVTHHAAFRNAATTVAALYDMKADPANRDTLTYEEEGGRHSIYFLRPRTREDLQRRMLGHRRIADATFGMFGRSPDHVASFVTGMVIKPDALPAPCARADNLIRYYRHIRDNDVYVVYAVLPPQAARNPEFYQRQNIPVPTLRVVREADDGVVISGMKMLATGAVYANEIWIGNVLPLAPDQKKESITCVIPCNAPGLTLWSRKPAVLGATSEFDSPLAWRYDEITSRTYATGRRCVFCSACAARSRRRPAPIRFPQCGKPSVRWLPSRARSAGWCTGKSTPASIGRRDTSASTAASCMQGSTGARRTTANSSTNCASSVAAACSRCRRTSRSWTTPTSLGSSRPIGRRRRLTRLPA
jgi:hypothetical protein